MIYRRKAVLHAERLRWGSSMSRVTAVRWSVTAERWSLPCVPGPPKPGVDGSSGWRCGRGPSLAFGSGGCEFYGSRGREFYRHGRLTMGVSGLAGEPRRLFVRHFSDLPAPVSSAPALESSAVRPFWADPLFGLVPCSFREGREADCLPWFPLFLAELGFPSLG